MLIEDNVVWLAKTTDACRLAIVRDTPDRATTFVCDVNAALGIDRSTNWSHDARCQWRERPTIQAHTIDHTRGTIRYDERLRSGVESNTIHTIFACLCTRYSWQPAQDRG